MKEPRIAIRLKRRGRWTPRRSALIDTGAANAVIPGAEGPVTCGVAFADILGQRYWGDVRQVTIKIANEKCGAEVEAFVPEGIDPRPSTRWDMKRPMRLKAVGSFEPILGHRFLEATGVVLRFGKDESVKCDPGNADPRVTAFVTGGPTMRLGVVCVRPRKKVLRKKRR